MTPTRHEQLCQQFGCVVISEDMQTIQIAGRDTNAPSKLTDAIKFATGKSVVWHSWSPAQLESAIQKPPRVLLKMTPESCNDSNIF